MSSSEVLNMGLFLHLFAEKEVARRADTKKEDMRGIGPQTFLASASRAKYLLGPFCFQLGLEEIRLGVCHIYLVYCVCCLASIISRVRMN